MKLPVDYDKIPIHRRWEVREAYIEQQKGICLHCGEPLYIDPSEDILSMWIDRDMFPPGFMDNPVHLHHDHGTGLTIGAVHARCNAVLFQYHGE